MGKPLRVEQKLFKSLSQFFLRRVYKEIIETKKEKLQTQKIRAKQNSNSPYKAGININHEKFGSGVILDTQGAGDDMVLIVKFKTGGIKNLLARIAGKKITIL